MTKEQIVEAIFKVLSENMAHPNMDKFHSDARLLEDLALDSSMVLQMLMLLEVCLLYTSPSPRDATLSRMPSSA